MEASRFIKITAEEAEAFRKRVREQNERIANMVVFDVDEFIKLVSGGGTSEDSSGAREG